MQKVCAIILLSALVTNYEALPQTKWSKQIHSPQGQLVRERRQFPFGDWVPLTQSCPTCRPFADPLDVGLRGESIGLTPPRPPTVTRQVHSEGNFFPQDESSILSVPPPPPSAIPRQPVTNTNGNFRNLQFSGFSQFNSPLPVPTQQIFPQTQQIQFLPQNFLPNQQLLVSNNQQVLPAVNNPNTIFGPGNQGKGQITDGKITKFNSEFKAQKLPENVVLEQNRPVQPTVSQFSNKPKPFTLSQTQGQAFGVQQQEQRFGGQQQAQQGFGIQQQGQQGFNVQQQGQQGFAVQQQGQHGFGPQQQGQAFGQQTFGGQQQHSVKFGDSILTPPPAPNNVSQDIVIPGLDKEEIQLLYVPVETLRQRGNFQQQLLTQQQQQQNIQFNRPTPSQGPIVSVRPTDQTTTKLPLKGHFVTQNGNSQGQSLSTLKSTSAQQFPTTVTPSTLFLQQLPFSQTPQPFVSATPATPTLQSFVTPSSVSQKFSAFTPETTLPHLSTIPSTAQFSQSDLQFATTPKTFLNQGGFQEQAANGKSQFSGFNIQQQPRPLQPQKQEVQTLVTQQQIGEREPQKTTLFFEEKQKELEIQNQIPNQQILEQEQIKQQEQQRLVQQQKEKEIQDQLLFKQRQQKELEAQRLLQLQKQKELEEQKLLQLQKQKELEQQQFLQQQRQKELEQQRYLQQQRQKELEQQRYLQQQREKELENQRRLQLQREKELEEKRRLQAIQQREEQQRLQAIRQKEEEQRLQASKQREEEERLFQFQQQQQREIEEQRLSKQQQQLEQQQLRLDRQKQDSLKKQQQLKFYNQQQQQQQFPQQQFPQQAFQQPGRQTLPANDKLNSISQLEKESEPETNQQLVPHQPPLSVFYKSHKGGNAQILDVLRELRSSKTITVLDQYFEKMPQVFVGPAGLIPPAGYGKFELPYLSNIESNRIERKIDRLPFFVAPLNFVPPPGYAKIPFPAPHVGSVVVSSEANPAMKVTSSESEQTSGSVEETGSFPMVGPEIPGLINGLETETTTAKPTFPSTPSLPQTTAQLRNRRPNTNLYRTQSRKPISKTRVSTTSKPEEEVTQSLPKTEATTEGGIRKPFNRFLHRRRQQSKTTTETPAKTQQDIKNLENRQYSVEVYHQHKNTNPLPGQQPKQNVLHDQKIEGESRNEFSSIDRSTPGGHGFFGVSPTPGFHNIQPTGEAVESEEHKLPEYSEGNLQTFEDGPLPTGSAKTITQELYRPNTIQISEQQRGSEISSKYYPKPDGVLSSEQFQHSSEEQRTRKVTEVSDVNPTAGFFSSTAHIGAVSEELGDIQPTQNSRFEKQEVPVATSERHYATESPRTENPFTPSSISISEPHPTRGFGVSDEFTSAFAEISKHHHIPASTEAVRGEQAKFSEPHPTPEISLNLQAPISKEFSQEQNSQEFLAPGDVRPTQNSQFYNGQFMSTGTSNEQFSTGFAAGSNSQLGFSGISGNPISSVAPGTTQETYRAGFAVNSNPQRESNSQEITRNSAEERRPSFVNFQNVHSTAESPVNFYSSTGVSTQEYFPVTPTTVVQQQKVSEETDASVQPETAAEISENPSTQSYRTESASENFSSVNDHKQVSEGQGQNFGDNLSNGHRLKLANPSIVRVRTRVRGKPRGQINFAASQTTTLSPDLRPKVEIKNNGNPEEDTGRVRDYQPQKTSKYNQYRGLKKPVRTTTEAPTSTNESEQKPSVYTIRPPRRLLTPSTVSTKRIRRPTTPVSTVETATEGFGISTPGHYSHSEDHGFSSSGVSNDVYYEHTSLSPIRQKFRKHFGSAEPKSDEIHSHSSTALPSTVQSYLSTSQEDYVQPEANIERELTQTVLETQEHSDRYPEWNPSESGIDVSGIVLTTIRTNSHEEQAEIEEPKKILDSKKAFDPDLEKKSGRRRVRVRVHKRPHENFETAESQNLRTVANVLVPPTSTYKPNDENNFHQLAKNSDFSFGGHKSFGVRSREYFKKRLNLTDIENVAQKLKEEDQSNSTVTNDERPKITKILGYVRKTEKGQKSENDATPAVTNENGTYEEEGNKILRTKYRGYIRKIIKHRGGAKEVKEVDSGSNHTTENEDAEGKYENKEFHVKQHELNMEGLNQTGRFNGTRHRTFVRYVKKNKIRPQGTEAHLEATSEAHLDEEINHSEETSQNVTESAIQSSEEQVSETESSSSEPTVSQPREEQEVSQFPVYQSTKEVIVKQSENLETSLTDTSDAVQTKEAETTEKVQELEESELKQTSPQTTQEPAPGQIFRNLFQPQRVQGTRNFGSLQKQTTQTTAAPVSQETESYQRPKFYQTSRPAFQRTPYTGFSRTKETGSYSTTEQIPEIQEKRDGPLRPRYGKGSGYNYSGNDKTEDVKKSNENLSEQQLKNKNLHTLEVRKYLRTKTREGAFSQFSKNRFYTSEKTEAVATTKDSEAELKESEEVTTPYEKPTATKNEKVLFESTSVKSKPQTTQSFVASTHFTGEAETTRFEENSELQLTTTEAIGNSEEESSEYEDTEDTSIAAETTTEGKTEIPTTPFKSVSSETVENLTEFRKEGETQTETKTEEATTEIKTETPAITEFKTKGNTVTEEVKSTETQPDLYRFSKSSFSFDEAEKFTGTKNRAHVRNITADIIESTASFSAPGVEKHIVPSTSDEGLPRTTELHVEVTNSEKTEDSTTEYNTVDTTTEYPERPETETVAATEIVTKVKPAKLIKTSTTTKISHETEICYKGKCIRTKSENPDDDLKLLVDSANIMKIEKPKT